MLSPLLVHGLVNASQLVESQSQDMKLLSELIFCAFFALDIVLVRIEVVVVLFDLILSILLQFRIVLVNAGVAQLHGVFMFVELCTILAAFTLYHRAQMIFPQLLDYLNALEILHIADSALSQSVMHCQLLVLQRLRQHIHVEVDVGQIVAAKPSPLEVVHLLEYH